MIPYPEPRGARKFVSYLFQRPGRAAAMAATCVDIDRILAATFVQQAEVHASLPSTNDRAAECAAQLPESVPLLILAEQQTAGRGRGGNAWWTGCGSLAFSLLVEAEMVGAERGRSPLVALAAAVAVVEAVAPRLHGPRVGIHWPNDIYVDDKKLAGILVEVLPSRQHVIGIGVNTNSSVDDAPEALRQTATTLFDLTHEELDPTAFLIALLERLEVNFELLRRSPPRVGWEANQLCLQCGKPLTLALGKRAFTGQCAGIGTDGALLLDTPKRQQRFYSGVVQEA
jgi:BirA family transcriptional regulator, biotin operon repressor / biotin---[acetyl-CoA-carboxylase] ligase